MSPAPNLAGCSRRPRGGSSSGGCVAVYAVGAGALLIVVGDAGLDTGRLDREAMAAVDSLAGMLTGPPAQATAS